MTIVIFLTTYDNEENVFSEYCFTVLDDNLASKGVEAVFNMLLRDTEQTKKDHNVNTIQHLMAQLELEDDDNMSFKDRENLVKNKIMEELCKIKVNIEHNFYIYNCDNDNADDSDEDDDAEDEKNVDNQPNNIERETHELKVEKDQKDSDLKANETADILKAIDLSLRDSNKQVAPAAAGQVSDSKEDDESDDSDEDEEDDDVGLFAKIQVYRPLELN